MLHATFRALPDDSFFRKKNIIRGCEDLTFVALSENYDVVQRDVSTRPD
jgi:hypothetical protein